MAKRIAAGSAVADRPNVLRLTYVDTFISCFADHGEGVRRGKCNGIGFGYRAAFVAWFPSKYRHLNPWGTGVVTDELISFEDLAPTVPSLTGVTPPSHMTGRSLLWPHRAARGASARRAALGSSAGVPTRCHGDDSLEVMYKVGLIGVAEVVGDIGPA